jgi:hypothetical protein
MSVIPAAAGMRTVCQVVPDSAGADRAPPERPGTVDVDWVLTGAAVVGGLLTICMVIYIGKVILRLVAFALCVASGVGGIVVLSPWLRSVMPDVLPPQISARVGSGILAAVISFLAGYVAALVLIGILGRPLRAPPKRE